MVTLTTAEGVQDFSATIVKEANQVPDAELLFRPAAELAEMVRAGTISARELVGLSLERISALDGELNAFVDVDAERALDAAGEVTPGDSRPFAGVPIAIKNNRAVEGMRLTQGCSLMAAHVADYDHNVTARLKRAGFIVVGTTTLPEYGILPVTEASLFGPTRNPWDLERTPGGSSGGSAAAVAAGMVPVAHGNDGGGSIRIPAACCGLVGLKAQRGRISGAPDVGQSLLVVDGVLTHTVADTAAIIDVLAGAELGDTTWAPPPATPFAVSASNAPAPARIAITTVPYLADAEVGRQAVQAVHRTAELLASLGHEVVEFDPPWPQPGMVETFGAVFCTHIALGIAYSEQISGREATASDMEPMSWALRALAKSLDAVQGLGLEARLMAVARQVVAALAPYDAVVTPVLASSPLPLGSLDTAAEEPLSTYMAAGHPAPFTAIFNATGQPAISLPLYEDDDGLPLAVQIAGRPASEGALLALAGQLEQALPWHDRRPPL
jgi:amidase